MPRAAVAQATTNFPVIGTIHRYDPQLDELIPKDAKIEVLSSRFKWAEGPVWVKDGGFLLFSDVIANQVMKWKEGEGVSVYLRPSGYTGRYPYSKEPGSNGLTLDSKGRLCSCEHGDRRVSVLTEGGGKRTLVDNYQGKRLNSPNDLCFKTERRPVFHRSAVRPAETGRRSDARARFLRRLPAVARRQGHAPHKGNDATQRARLLAGREDALRGPVRSEGGRLDGVSGPRRRHSGSRKGFRRRYRERWPKCRAFPME